MINNNDTIDTTTNDTTTNTTETARNTCPICIEEIDSVNEYNTPCGHCFHNDCIQTWLVTNNSCPMCRARVLEEPELVGPRELVVVESTRQIVFTVLRELVANNRAFTIANISIEVRRYFAWRRHVLRLEAGRLIREQRRRL